LNALQWGLFAVLLAGCGYAFFSDLYRRRIPNWLCAALLLPGLVAGFLTGGAAGLGDHALHMVMALVVGMVLTRLGAIGAGDAKFYAACAAWFGLGAALGLLVSVSLAGLLLFAVWFGWRRIKRLPVRNRTGNLFDSLPYGIAIAAGTILSWPMLLSLSA